MKIKLNQISVIRVLLWQEDKAKSLFDITLFLCSFCRFSLGPARLWFLLLRNYDTKIPDKVLFASGVRVQTCVIATHFFRGHGEMKRKIFTFNC